MLHQLAEQQSGRRVWWLHGARDGTEHALAAESAALLQRLEDEQANRSRPRHQRYLTSQVPRQLADAHRYGHWLSQRARGQAHTIRQRQRLVGRGGDILGVATRTVRA